MPDRLVGRLADTGDIVLVEYNDAEDDDIEYVVRHAELPTETSVGGWSVAWLFVIIAFILGLVGGGVFL
jgi:hypothetical protein